MRHGNVMSTELVLGIQKLMQKLFTIWVNTNVGPMSPTFESWYHVGIYMEDVMKTIKSGGYVYLIPVGSRR